MAGADLVSIFWDYENCRPPSGVAGNVLVDRIRTIAHQYGRVTGFKAYFDLAESVSSRSPNIRSELQSSGVSLNDCPHDGRKDVADKMIIVDMLAFAIDHPAPATVILISGDRDFAYAVSVLRLRMYRVIVITPKASSASIKYSASEVLDWDRDIVPETVSVSKSNWRRRPSDSQSSDTSDSSSLDASTGPFPSVTPSFEQIRQRWRLGATLSSIRGSPVSELHYTSSRPSLTSTGHESSSSLASSDSSSGLATPPGISPPAAPGSPGVSSFRGDAKVFKPTHTPSQSFFTVGGLAAGTPYVRSISSPVTIKTPSGTPITFNSESVGGGEKIISSSYAAIAGASGPPGQCAETAKISKAGCWKPAGSTQVPPQFRQLAIYLEKARLDGSPKQVWSIVASGIKDRKSMYEKAGVTSFREFAELAKKAGIVTLGGDPGDCPWICLRPEWYNRVGSLN
ncbi:DUF537-domain-containing protein [Neolentinus lepideus HHB14362 ss-1]|uniref:DUF537-domain-containing protein n=1 Tax=Neolentinus lepideus HHB14362 ss-1 TaxID=1314782 RepID=A0A165UIR0_9AGAM|nr:DUF537-domain-containing protein [Neolentinus lepideus HHB14362 ss-1]